MGDRLRGKVALISGAAQGIGEAHARLFAAQGAQVVIGDIQRKAGRDVAAKIVASGGEATFVYLDVTRESNWTEAIAETQSRFGALTTLVNNAGVYHAGGLEDESLDGWNRLIAVDQTGVFLGMKTAIPALRGSGNGAIVNISSVMGMSAVLPCFSYHAAKAAVRMMSRAAALEYAKLRIRVNSIYPGSIDTPILANTRSEDRAAISAAIPMGYLGKPEDIANASIFLCSDEACYVNGAELSVDGGLYPG